MRRGRGLRLYLAGPEVFLPDAAAIGEAKKAICSSVGFVGVFPLDDPAEVEPDAAGIYARCIAMMRGCDAVVANLTPFRGIGADVGTAFELGFMAASGKPLFGYSNVPGTVLARTGAAARAGSIAIPAGAAIEDFGHFDNLMLAEALATDGGVRLPPAPVADPDRELSVFRACIESAARRLGGGVVTKS